MATSNDTRVRVDGRSKIIASVLPASGRSWPNASPYGARQIDHPTQFLRRHVDQI